VLALVPLLVLVLGVPATRAAGGPSLDLRVQGESLMLRASDAPLAEVLARLTEASGIIFRSAGPLDEPVTLDLSDTGLEEGLQRLLRHRDTIFLYDEDAGRLAAVYILGHRGTDAHPVSTTAADDASGPEAELALSADADRSAVMDTLHRLAGAGTAGVESLARALRDSDTLVQGVALQILLDRGVAEGAVPRILAAAEAEDEASVRRILRALLGG
jgi:hypothetical protein